MVEENLRKWRKSNKAYLYTYEYYYIKSHDLIKIQDFFYLLL